MKIMLDSLKSVVRYIRQPHSLFGDKHVFHNWIDTLDLTRPNETAINIMNKIETFLNTQEQQSFHQDQLTMLFSLDTPIHATLNSLHREYIRSGQTHYYAYECRILHQIDQFIESVIKLYHCFNLKIKHNLDSYTLYYLHQRLNRNLIYLYAQRVRIYRYQHESLPAELWNNIIQLYFQDCYAQQLTHNEESVFPTIEDSYTSIFMSTLLDLGSYTSEWYPLIDQWIQESPAILFLDTPPEATLSITHGWCIDFSTDKNLQRRNIVDIHSAYPVKWFHINPFIETITAQKKQIEARLTHVKEPQSRVDLLQRLACIKKLERDCSPMTPLATDRIALRHIQLESVEWVAGLEAIEKMYFSSCSMRSNPIKEDQSVIMKQLFSQGYLSSYEDDQESCAEGASTFNTCYLKDINQYGCALRIQHTSRVMPAVGMLIAYRRPQQEEWCMGIVRRVRRLLRTEIEVGVEHIGSKWSIVDYSSKMANVMEETPFRYAFFFPSDQQNSKSYPVLLIPQPHWDPAQTVALKHILNGVQFHSIIEQKRDWSLLGFSNPTKDDGVEKKNYAA